MTIEFIGHLVFLFSSLALLICAVAILVMVIKG